LAERVERPRSKRLIGLRPLWAVMAPYRLRVFGALLAMALATGAVMALGQGMKYLVDEGLVAGQTQQLDRGVLVLFVIAIVLAMASYSRFYLVTSIGERVVADLRKRVFSHLLTLSPAFFEVTRTGEVLSRLTNDTTLLQGVVGSSLPFAMRNLMLVVGGLVLLFVTSIKLAGIILLVVPLVVLPIMFLGRRVRALSRVAQGRVADVTAEANETIHAIRMVQAYNHENLDALRFDSHIEVAFTAALAWIRARARLTAVVMLLVFGAVCLGVWIGGYDVLNHQITAGQLLTFIFYAVVVASAVGGLGESWGDLQRAAGAMERLSELLATEPTIAPPVSPLALSSSARGAVSFEDVAFSYPLRPERRSVEGMDLQVVPGEKLALVGPSGAGKTTVFQLLLRFYDPQAGRICFDGVDIAKADPSEVRRRIGLVPQEPVIFSHSAMENIRYGRPEASDAEVRAAAEAAFAAEFLDRLPDGLATPLGERGVRLSGGQRQRIAIARAILRSPALLLLDEATSALDAESEQVVQKALERLMEGRTTIVIAHRLATVQKCDRIVVMDHGRIVAVGSHGELVRQGGLYARLAALQFDQPLELTPRSSADPV
jgi:ATP-binding cassette, subfamily B, bacterial